MGWWKVQGIENVICDVALDALDAAVISVIAEYQAEFSRLPTSSEWEALLLAVLHERAGAPLSANGIVSRVRLE